MIKQAFKFKKLLFLLILSIIFSQAYAQYEMKKYTINSGGEKMSAGQYELTASIGQTDANNTLTGGSYSLNAGFWHENTDLIFKDGFK
ncbi:hypothetical protein GCM10011365_04910 [Marinicella pacifica]|uniref:Uncharacterized protein n=1 Tax=Marinicella pacifica TaxID=1171543 RepID=A0A917CHB2_9GAMM|nr:hypothetical protein [Marinicella pacifica]GGF86869.1 hypothetical protein GCM10011365_04910 [Marinicella pacifica]